MDIINHEVIEQLETELEKLNDINKHNQKIFDSIREKEQARKRVIEDVTDRNVDIELQGGRGNKTVFRTMYSFSSDTEQHTTYTQSFSKGQQTDKIIADPNRSIIGDLKVINGTPESKIKIAIRKKFLLIQMNWTFDDDKFLVLAEQLESMLQLEQDIKEED